MKRRQFLQLSASAAALGLIVPASEAKLMAGTEYAALDFPQATTDPDRIEVLELFYYGCPHCFELEPYLVSWLKKMPKQAYFRRMPAIFNDGWVPMAKAFYAAEALGLLEKLHAPMFDAIHVKRLNLNSKDALLNFVSSQGVDAAKFGAAYDSFGVQARVKEAYQLTGSYGITGVPAIVVDGKYRTSSSMAGGHAKLPTVLNELIALAQRERGGKR